MRKKLYIAFFFLFFSSWRTEAQLYNFSEYNVQHGLPQSQVNSIFEDSRGYLWFATQGGGVSRFDGINFVTYSELSGLEGQMINDIEEDSKGNLWLADNISGLYLLDGKKFQNFNFKKSGLISNSVKCLLYLKQRDQLLIGTDVGMSVFESGKFTHFPGLGLDRNVRINCMVDLGDKGVLLGTEFGVFRYDGVSIVKLDFELNDSIKVNSMCIGNQRIWLGCDNGVISLDPFDLSLIDFSEEMSEINRLNGTRILAVQCDNYKRLWIGTSNKGVFLHFGNELMNFSKKNGFPATGVNDIFCDQYDRTWFGTQGGGTVRFNGFSFTYFFDTPGLKEGDVFALHHDKRGGFWVGTQDEGLFYYYEGNSINWSEDKQIPLRRVRSITSDQKGNIYVASSDGLLVITGDKHRLFTQVDGLPTNDVKSILVDKNGQVWVGTNGSGLMLFKDDKFIRPAFWKEEIHPYIHSLLQDSQGSLWLGTGNGVYKVQSGQVIQYASKDGLCNTYIGSIVEDKFGNIWVGTDRCIARFNGRKFTPITVEDGLSSGTVYLLNTDLQGNLWVGTNKGLDKISFTTYGQVENIRNYSVEEGFRGIECNTRATCRDENGLLYFGTVMGVIRFNPFEERSLGRPPRVHITNVKMFYDDIDLRDNEGVNWFGVPDELVLRNDQNNVSLTYSGLANVRPKDLTYSYILEGYDKDWSPLTSNTSANYSNLPPGTYTFKVKARSYHNLWSRQEASFSFSIKPAFWQTWWFYLLLLGGITYGIYSVNMLIQKRVIRHNEILEEKVNIRTRELQRQKEEKEVLLKEIHHRVKNNMQVIVSLLNIHSDFVKDPESLELLKDSRNRIRSMSLIHEKLYESKDFTRVNIDEYLESLVTDLVDAYGIDTKITIEKEIESNSFGFDTIIPLGLLLNEIVSNSIKYAFPGREEGKLSFSLKRSGEAYDLIVGDDGVGMPRSVWEESGKTLGVELIKILSEQLNGTAELLDRPGTVFLIHFTSIDKRRI